ncbi:aldo/keto reductase [Nonomuraea sp. KC401]|uniref:aldo/keto reductase n=1 Tax=unclassified Nonomuraea TaxID=2593643 RepID=UPI0010FE653D|nr:MULTISPECIES: aldo/keto reductase [unclassified Nonomuraea]NBE99592.1 aldo/keto reductase [Nonomuraea sp. K271]TLF56787.1 aldo/keto reductase [Nonomuraea sp. KC401]
MRYRLLGRTGLRVSQLFLGAMTYRESSPEVRRVFDLYADAGGNVVDTASIYGESENVVGELLQGRRDRFVLATKYTGSIDGTDPNAAGNHRKSLVRSLEQSLRRLRTDYVDLFWVHVWDRHTPVEETMRALDDAVSAGKVLYAGISDAPAWVASRANTLAEWRGWTPFAGLQVPYSLLSRDVERELLPMAQAYGMSVAAWGVLAQGVLSGRYNAPDAAASRRDPGSLTERERTAARAVVEVAAELGVTASQVAIAWVLRRGVHPILGASTVEQLKDNLAATGVELPGEAARRLESAVGFELGFPGDFIDQVDRSPGIYGEAVDRLDGR